MCEQCLTNPIYFGEPLPGLYLARARRDGNDWKKREWGLIEINDPSFVWTSTPTVNPCFGMDLDEIEAYVEAHPGMSEDEENRAYGIGGVPMDFIDQFSLMDPEFGHFIVGEAIKVGFRPKIDTFVYWFYDYLGKWILEHDGESGDDPLPHLDDYSPTDYTIGKE